MEFNLEKKLDELFMQYFNIETELVGGTSTQGILRREDLVTEVAGLAKEYGNVEWALGINYAINNINDNTTVKELSEMIRKRVGA